jgi:glycosyltransferase involved in cell wall biosynthesis
VHYEKKYLGRADLVITVEDSLSKIYVEKAGVDKEKIVSLPNTPGAEVFQIQNIDPAITKKYQNRFVLFYGGSLDHIRGIDFVAECVAVLKEEINNIVFLIAGKENRAFSLHEIIRERNIDDFVDYVGWIPLDILPSYIATSHICVFVPRADNLEINNTIATKIYQYAAMGKPVIVSEAQMMKNFVEGNSIGFSVQYGDIQGFCEVVRRIFRHPEIAEGIRAKAIQVAGEYVWEKTSRAFVEAYLHMNQQT